MLLASMFDLPISFVRVIVQAVSHSIHLIPREDFNGKYIPNILNHGHSAAVGVPGIDQKPTYVIPKVCGGIEAAGGLPVGSKVWKLVP